MEVCSICQALHYFFFNAKVCFSNSFHMAELSFFNFIRRKLSISDEDNFGVSVWGEGIK